MVTTETSFFRDHAPFEAFEGGAARLDRGGAQRRLNIWCAGSSTGQEPYQPRHAAFGSIFPELANWNVSLLASDISREVLDRARQGCYNQIEVNRGLAGLAARQVFQPARHALAARAGTFATWSSFRKSTWPSPGQFCRVWTWSCIRNVMIYFDVETKKAILGRLARLLRPDGYLLLGGAETTFNLDDSFRRPVRASQSGLLSAGLGTNAEVSSCLRRLSWTF